MSSRASARPIPDAPPVTNAEQPENVESMPTGSPYDALSDPAPSTIDDDAGCHAAS